MGGRAACIFWMQRAGPCCPQRAPLRPWPRSCLAGLPRCPSLQPTSQVHARASLSKDKMTNTALECVAIPQQHSTRLALGLHGELRRADIAVRGPRPPSAC